MSLNTSTTLKPRDVIENSGESLEKMLQKASKESIFKQVIGLEDQTDLMMLSMRAVEPINYIIVGPPGNGKSLIIKCVYESFKQYAQWIDSTTSSGIGMIERIIEKVDRLRFLCVDELEKFSTSDRYTLLGLLGQGTLSRNLKDTSVEYNDLKVWFYATCNDIRKIQRQQPEFLDRCGLLEIPKLDKNVFYFVAGKRLLKEEGIDNEAIGTFIAQRVFEDIRPGETNMRWCIRLAQLAYSYARSNNTTVNKDIVDMVAELVKDNIYML